MKRALRWLAIAVGGLAIIPAAAIVALLAIDAEVYRDALIDQVEGATGHPFSIDGSLTLRPSLTPTLVAGKVRIGNRSPGPKGDLLRIERLEARLPIIPLLRGDVRIERLMLVRPELVLVADGQGSGNWAAPPGGSVQAAAGEIGDGMKLRLSIRDARLRDGRVRVVDPARGKEWTVGIAEARLRAASLAAPMRIAIRGTFGGEDFFIEGDGPAIEALGVGAGWPISVKGALAKTQFELSGTIAAAGNANGTPPAESRLAIKAEIADLALLGRVFDARLPTAKPIQAKASVDLVGKRIRIADLDATAGGSHVAGTLEAALDGHRPHVAGALTGDTVDLGDFGLVLQAEDGNAAPPVPPPAADARKRLFSDTPLPAERLGDVDLDLAVQAGRLIAGRLELAQLAARIALHDRRLAVAPFEASLAGGAATGELRIDGTPAEPAVSARLEWRGLDLAALLAMTGNDAAIAGKTNLVADIKGQGVSVQGLLASLDGSIGADLTDGHIPGRTLDLLGEDLARHLISIPDDQRVTALRCGIARFTIRRGLAESQALALDSAKISLTGSGRTDLGRESLDFRLVPRPKDPSLMSLGIPVLVRGTYLEPEFVPDRAAAVGGLLGGAIGTVLLGPIGVLLPLASTGTGQITDCIRLMRDSTEPPPPSDPDAPRQDSGAPRPSSPNPVNSIRGLFRNLEQRLTR